jgi:glycosidase
MTVRWSIRLMATLGIVFPQGPPIITSDAPEPAPQPSPKVSARADPTGPTVPAWARDARWYQVVVPCFHNGERSNDPPGTLRWTTNAATVSPSTAADRTPAARQYGGDLQGLQKRLPYLEALGVNSLYLTSLFEDLPARGDPPADLRHINRSVAAGEKAGAAEDETHDPKTRTFTAGDRVFLAFLKEAHERGFRVVVEAFFGDVRKALPDGVSVEAHLFELTRRWMDPTRDGDPSDGIDGWVLHEPQAMPREFWKRWRSHVKKINPDALLIGDIRGEAAPWLAGDAFDTAINRDLAKALERFLGSGSPTYALKDFLADLTAINERHTLNVRLAAPVPLSGPDLGRLLSALSLRHATEGQRKPGSGLVADLRAGPPRWRLATLMQYTFVGAPMIYYGDEVGMYRRKGQANLAPMWWRDPPAGESPRADYRSDFASLVQWLNIRRNLHAPLRSGELRVLLADEKRALLAFARSLPGDEVILVVNYGKTKHKVMLPAGRPGRLAGVLGPRLNPMPPPDPKGDKLIRPLSVGGSRRIVSDAGTIRLWIDPMSVRLVLVRDEPPH